MNILKHLYDFYYSLTSFIIVLNHSHRFQYRCRTIGSSSIPNRSSFPYFFTLLNRSPRCHYRSYFITPSAGCPRPFCPGSNLCRHFFA